jgi:hypothetical protein
MDSHTKYYQDAMAMHYEDVHLLLNFGSSYTPILHYSLVMLSFILVFKVGAVNPGSWAERHLEPGDSILAIDGKHLETDFKTSTEIQKDLAKNPVVL